MLSSSSSSSSSSSTTTSPFIPTLILLISLPIIFLLAPRILPPRHLPPISLPDELDDLSLRRASYTPIHNHRKSHLGSTNPTPKIAFLFLTNSDLHFSPLWQLFFLPNNKSQSNLFNIYIHSDPTVRINPPGGVFSSNRFIPSKKTHRGSPSLVSAARRLLATALLDDPSNSFFTLISQHCVPLHSFSYLYTSLFDLKHHQIAELPHLKFKSFIEIISQDPYLHDRYDARGKNIMLPEIPFSKFRVGSQFWTLTRPHALLIVRDRRLWSKFKITCINTASCYPEEHYFPTLLSMEDPEGCSRYTLTRVNWTGSVNGHPHTYGPAELSPALISELRRSNFGLSHMFARKFSPDCLQPLLQMASTVLFRD